MTNAKSRDRPKAVIRNKSFSQQKYNTKENPAMKKIFRPKSFAARVLAMILVVMSMTAIFAATASAAPSWPSVSASSYCEFTANKTIYAYRNSSCTTRGTASPAKSYNAYIASGDVCRIIEFNGSWIKLQYPTSSGYKTAFIRRSDLLGVSAPSDSVISNGKVTTYKSAGGGSYGYVAKGDRVFACGTSGSFTAVIYEARSGSRAYKLGYVYTSSFNSTIKGGGSVQSSGSFQWPMKNYWTTQSFNHYSNSKAKEGRPYHSGIDIKSNDYAIYAAASGKVIYRGYSNGNGNHIVIEHYFNGVTVKTLYSHLADFNGCPSVGSSVSKGARIATMGSTGNSTGPHLHFAIFTGSSNDPSGYAKNSGANKVSHNGCTFYNPVYVINNNKLP